MFQKAYGYVFVLALVLFLCFIVYIYFSDHQKGLKDDSWIKEFQKVGLDPEDISHDDSVWYFQKQPTCVAYSAKNAICPRHESYCARGKTYGSILDQVKAVKEAAENGGEHPQCPLIYPGAP